MREKFPKLSDAKLKERIFIGLQICEIINDDLSEHLLTETEKSAWLTFRAVCLNFLGNIKAENYNELVENKLNAYQTMRCNMSLKIHFYIHTGTYSLSTWAQWATNMWKGSTMEKRYVGKSSQNMLADYCWNLNEEVSVASYKWMSYKKKFETWLQ